MKDRDKRLSRLEAALAPVLRLAPPVIHVGIGQTIAETFVGFAERFTGRAGKRKQTVLVVPAKPRNDAEEADMLARFKVQQEALVADAKASRPAPPPPEAMPEPEQQGPARRVVRGRVRIGEPFRAPKPEPKD